jgi:hypothetical protein
MTERLEQALLFICLLILSVSFSLYSQDDSRIVLFNGGRIQQHCQINWNGLSGMNVSPGSGICAGSAFPAAATLNPASLTALHHFAIQLDYIPPLQIELADPLDLDRRVATATDDAMEEFKTSETKIEYSHLSTRLRQSDQLAAGVLAGTWGRQRFALYFYRPFDILLNGMIAGVRTQINAKMAMSDKKEDIFFNSYIDGVNTLRATSVISGISLAREWSSVWRSGLSIEQCQARVQISGRLDVEGSMLFGGKENAFNDPDDPWHNDLHQLIDADYRGHSLGIKLGQTAQLAEHWQAAILLDWRADMHAQGQLTLLNNMVPALNLSADSGEKEEILDPEKLKLSQLTLTQTADYTSYPNLIIRWPGTLRFGLLYQHHRWETQLNYSYGLSPFALRYGPDEIGVKPAHSIRLGIVHPWLQLGLGASIIEKTAKGSKRLGDSRARYIIPQFSLGTGFNFKAGVHLILTLVTVPLPVLRTSVLLQL